MLPEYTRRGIASEAAQTLLDYVEREQGVKDVLGFEDRGLHVLKTFGDVKGQVFTKPGMDHNLETYGM